ncbi:hypothetical protein EUGRSUZ_H04110 [Eucalyptus grandis]|uniref:Uncharacterized protein n=2 Tax=Eucalyptus grandis TaxID=71139 RepID=A0ACC3JVM5_EUCGR|nr:hypothetical protein EUGRSUZ_H04110 [Eucalyptus grandis]
MAHDGLGIDGLNLRDSCNSAPISEDAQQGVSENDGGIKITCFSEVVNDSTLHFQIIRLEKQIYAWIGCNSSKLGRLYAAAPTRPANLVSVTSILGGASDNTGSGIARRLGNKFTYDFCD